MPYKEVSESLKNIEFVLSLTKIEQAISVLREEDLLIDLPVEENKPIIRFYNNIDSQVLITRFKNE
jgi:hypothetical protein